MFYSPLRYPGGKSKLAPFMKILLNNLNMQDITYVEPFAGGAGIGLDLLYNGIVSNIVINDVDKAIVSFWKGITEETDRFIEELIKVPLTIDEWKKQKEIYNTNQKNINFELGFAAFYLNRTNRSGIIKTGGVIGGLEQSGEWKMDARFDKEKLIEKIRLVAQHKNSIKIYNKDIISFIENYLKKLPQENTFVYFDPPYYNKAEKLYKNYFLYSDHEKIEKYISEKVKCNWMITYDDAPEIIHLYKDYELRKFDLNYSANSKRKASEIMIFSKPIVVPSEEEIRKLNINYRMA